MKTSWQPVVKWYHENVGEEGHYYHKHVILPKIMAKLKGKTVVDLACGQGVLGRHVDPHKEYVGYDIAPSFIRLAKQQDKSPQHTYLVQDCTKPFTSTRRYECGVCLLALQNMDELLPFFQNARKLLLPGSQLHLVLNHPCFRIPRQSSWGVDEEKKLQYRRMDRYLTPMKIPIQAAPSKGEQSAQTWSFHYALSAILKPAFQAGFQLSDLEEWISDKESTGKKSKMENRAREEFPLFLYLELINTLEPITSR